MKEWGNKMEYNNTQECFENTMEKLNFKCTDKNTNLYTKFLRSGEMLEAKLKDNTYRLRAFKGIDGDMVLNLSVTFKTLIEFKCYYFGYTCNECEYDSL